jgi:hypothetical protein
MVQLYDHQRHQLKAWRASIVMRSRTCLTQTAMLAELSVDKQMSVQNIRYSM